MEEQLVSNEAVASRARAYIAAMPPAISGQHGHDATFAVAKKLMHDFGMTEAQAWPILLDYNARCQPPWNEDELRHKLEGAGNLTRAKKPRGHLREEIAKSMPPLAKLFPGQRHQLLSQKSRMPPLIPIPRKNLQPLTPAAQRPIVDRMTRRPQLQSIATPS